jgi:hypothetical protein
LPSKATPSRCRISANRSSGSRIECRKNPCGSHHRASVPLGSTLAFRTCPASPSILRWQPGLLPMHRSNNTNCAHRRACYLVTSGCAAQGRYRKHHHDAQGLHQGLSWHRRHKSVGQLCKKNARSMRARTARIFHENPRRCCVTWDSLSPFSGPIFPDWMRDPGKIPGNPGDRPRIRFLAVSPFGGYEQFAGGMRTAAARLQTCAQSGVTY